MVEVSSSDSSDGDSECSEYVIDVDDDAQDQANSSSDDSELSVNEVDHDSVEEEPKNPATEESRYDKVIKLLAKGGDLNGLRLEECKAYLRKHGLRITGTKSVCIQRIQEHIKVKDGGAQKLYPKSSFVINCRGDVCTGDIVLFSQKVFEKYDLASRGGAQTPIGKRTIAGRIVKDSYGAAKQQHTFTVEILWSTGVKPLPPLYPLLIKGRNLYRMQTYRQKEQKFWQRSMQEGLKLEVLELLQRHNMEAKVINILKILIALNHLGSGADLRNWTARRYHRTVV